MTARPALPSLLAAATLAASGLVLAGCHSPETAERGEGRQARSVRVAPVAERPITGSITASGPLVPREEAAVMPEVTGYRVARVLADEGQWVRRGQTLAVLDGALLQSQVEQQQALAAQAAVQAEQAESQAERVEGLDGQGVLSEEQLEQRRFQARAARATANAQAAALRDLRTRASKLSVAAPVAGLVLERNVRPGELAAGGAGPWFRIAENGAIELEAQLSEEDLARLRPGMGAVVTLPNGVTVNGQVRLVSPQIDPQTRLGTARVRLPVRQDIRAGGFGRAVFGGSGEQVRTVPETAVRYDADGASVMVVGADNRVRRVAVQTGQRGGGLVELVRGPPVGARVVQSASAFLLDGDLVQPVTGGSAQPAGKAQPQPKAAQPQAEPKAKS